MSELGEDNEPLVHLAVLAAKEARIGEIEARLAEAQATNIRLTSALEVAELDNAALQARLAVAVAASVSQSSEPSPRGLGLVPMPTTTDPALLGVQDKIIRLTREQSMERQTALFSLKEEQRRLAAIRKEILETERTNSELKKTLARTDIKKLREQKEALSQQVGAPLSCHGSGSHSLAAPANCQLPQCSHLPPSRTSSPSSNSFLPDASRIHSRQYLRFTHLLLTGCRGGAPGCVSFHHGGVR